MAFCHDWSLDIQLGAQSIFIILLCQKEFAATHVTILPRHWREQQQLLRLHVSHEQM